MRILIPDALLLADVDLERSILGGDATLRSIGRPIPTPSPTRNGRPADAVVVFHLMRLEAPVIAKLARAKIIVRAGVGFDTVDVAAAGARGIPVCNVPDYGISEIADHAIGLLLTLARGTHVFTRNLIADPVKGWDVAAASPTMIRLRHARFGCVGLGRTGTATARRARALDMSVGFYDPYLPPGQELALGLRRYEKLHDLLGDCDVVSIHTPLTPETRALVDDAAIAAMKRGMLLINTARGAIADLDAVCDGLESGQLRGIGFDVLPQEPPSPDHRLFKALKADEPWISGRVVLSPHAAFYSHDSQIDMRRLAIETALQCLKGQGLRSHVNRDVMELPGRSRSASGDRG